jgi:effector-binding domain-containing protein
VAQDFVIKEIPDQLALTVRKRVSMATIGQAMGEAFGTIMAHAEASGAHYAGPPFCYYPDEIGEQFDVVVCLPVLPGATAGPGVDLETVPGGTAASTVHVGPYSAMEPTYAALQEWVAANGKRPAGPPREVYLNDPATVPASELLTEIIWPVA